MQWITAYVGLGSNLQEPIKQVQQAYAAMAHIPATQTQQLSPLYTSSPIGPAGQPDYINAVAHLLTRLPPLSLLSALQAIEIQQQRVRDIHWGPRTIDLDLLLYGRVTIDTPQLNVPHQHLKQRNFVLAPLLDLAPQLRLPDQSCLAACLTEVGWAGLAPLKPVAVE